jgi:hypothetical protein
LDWVRFAVLLDAFVDANRDEILRCLNFESEYGPCELKGYDKIRFQEEENVLREIKGVLFLAAAVYVDAGIQAPNKMVATLKAIRKNPTLVLERNIEPGALGELAKHYRRAEEPLGTHFYDITGDCSDQFRQIPARLRIQAAVDRAIAALQACATSGRPPAYVDQLLARGLGPIFLRFNEHIGRQSIFIGTKTVNDKEIMVQAEGGPFLEFLQLILQPLNSHLNDLPAPLSRKWVSAASVARIASDRANRINRFNRTELKISTLESF